MDSQKEKEVSRTAELAVETLGKDLLEALLQEVRLVPQSWAQLGPIEQENLIDRLRRRVQLLLRDAVSIMFAGETPAVRARLSGLKFGKEIQCVLSIARDATGRHELLDAVGMPVVLIMADPNEYMAAMDTVKARAAQGDLFQSNVAGMIEQAAQMEITDAMIVDGLHAYGLDLRAPVWSTLRTELQHLARSWYMELDANPSAAMPGELLPYVTKLANPEDPFGDDDDDAADGGADSNN